MLHPSAEGTGSGKFTIRAVHLVDPAGVLQLSMMYPTTTGTHMHFAAAVYIVGFVWACVPVCLVGRNFTEILRCLDSLQLAAKHKARSPMLRRCLPYPVRPAQLAFSCYVITDWHPCELAARRGCCDIAQRR